MGEPCPNLANAMIGSHEPIGLQDIYSKYNVFKIHRGTR